MYETPRDHAHGEREKREERRRRAAAIYIIYIYIYIYIYKGMDEMPRCESHREMRIWTCLRIYRHAGGWGGVGARVVMRLRPHEGRCVYGTRHVEDEEK